MPVHFNLGYFGKQTLFPKENDLVHDLGAALADNVNISSICTARDRWPKLNVRTTAQDLPVVRHSGEQLHGWGLGNVKLDLIIVWIRKTTLSSLLKSCFTIRL